MKPKKADASLLLVFLLAMIGIFLILYFHLCGNWLWSTLLSLSIGLISGLVLFSQIHYAGFIISPIVFLFLMAAGWLMQAFSLCAKYF